MWIYFDLEDQGQPAPRFRLERVNGGTVASDDFLEQANLVLVFLSASDPAEVREALAALSDYPAGLAQHNGELLVILPERVAQLPETAVNVLVDPEGRTRSAYSQLMDPSLTRAEDQLLFILDAYGGPYAAYVGTLEDLSGLQSDVESWLAYVSIQCPE